ncbi:MAG: CpsD/CapB family tyrosine-protein kinase [Anaerolineales bacterium]|nr:CpsD/CapB family tyrosine-protein kinase [Anaerolineales bacterium]
MKLFTLPDRKEVEPGAVHAPVMDMHKIDPFYDELFKGLRAKIEYKIDMVDLRVLAVSSAIAGEGKTLTAINLAANMASTGRKKVLLLDLDFRKPSVGKMLSFPKGPGISDYLWGTVPKEEIIRKATMPGLFVIPVGKTNSSPADTLAGEKFRSFLQGLRSQFDLVIIDTPPVLPVPDAVTISEQVDAFIMLFRLSYTPHHLFRKALEEIGERKIMGVVLNGEEKKSDKYYSRYYGHYYKKVAQ